jgi:hypothetical protein
MRNIEMLCDGTVESVRMTDNPRLNILVVDDHVDNVRSMSLLPKALGHNVTGALSGVAAITHARQCRQAMPHARCCMHWPISRAVTQCCRLRIRKEKNWQTFDCGVSRDQNPRNMWCSSVSDSSSHEDSGSQWFVSKCSEDFCKNRHKPLCTNACFRPQRNLG